MTPPHRRTTLALLLIGLGAAAVLWWQTPYGLGLEGDSADYVSMARQLADGRLPRFDAADGRRLPMTQFPPAYPLLLAAGDAVGVDVLPFARASHALLLAATVFLIGRVALRHTRSPPLALAAAAYLALSPQVQLTFASLMSEALFVPLLLLIVFASIKAPGEAASAAGFRRTLTSALLVLETVTRYAGVFFALAVCASSFCRKPRLIRMIAAIALTLAPLVAWSLWLRHLGAEPSRIVRWHAADAATLRRSLSAVGGWVLPVPVGGGVPTALAGAAVTAALLWTVGRRLKRLRRAAGGPGLWAALLLFYAAGLWASRLWLDEAMPMGVRLWLPALPLAVLLAADAARRFARRGRAWRAGITIGVTAVLCLAAVSTARQALALRRDGIGYASPAWRDSPTLAYVRSLPPETPVVSNAADAVTLLLGRDVAPLPMTVFRTSGNDNVRWRDELRTGGKRLRATGGVIVFFDAVDRRDFLVRERQLREVLRVVPAAVLPDGRAYRVVGIR